MNHFISLLETFKASLVYLDVCNGKIKYKCYSTSPDSTWKSLLARHKDDILKIAEIFPQVINRISQEGYFIHVPEQRVRIAVTTIVDTLLTYAPYLIQRLELSVQTMAPTYSHIRGKDDAGVHVISNMPIKSLQSAFESVKSDFSSTYASQMSPLLIEKGALIATTGVVLCRGGVLSWPEGFNIYAVGDYLEVLVHSQYSQKSEKQTPAGGSHVAQK